MCYNIGMFGISRHEGDAHPHIDALTGLPNRGILMPELERQATFNPGNFALLFLDLDKFKTTNDRLGHAAGDAMLKDTADVLRASVRQDPERQDYVGRDVFRLSGDEFVIVLPGADTQEKVDIVSQRIQDNLFEQKQIQASIDGRPHKPNETGERLLDAVDKMMLKQKRARHRALKIEKVGAAPQRKKLAFWVGNKLVKYSDIKFDER